MIQTLFDDVHSILDSALDAVKPDSAVYKALQDFRPEGRVFLVSVGKAAWQMAAAVRYLPTAPAGGIVITKYGHVKHPLPGIVCCEAAHPVPDEQGFWATEKVIKMVEHLRAEDTVLFLLSGGGSALFEAPLVSGQELQSITNQLLASGANIMEINTIRKRLSKVKGGRFAQICAPAKVFNIILSDVLGDQPDMIASGPTVPDTSTSAQALSIAEKYQLKLSAESRALLMNETPKQLDNVTTQITGSVRELCAAAAASCRALGYDPVLLTDSLCCEAREAGSFLGAVARSHSKGKKRMAFIAGGETVVHLTGQGLGGRNQELALGAAPLIDGLENCCVFSVGSDGTDGPTDAAGGYVDGYTAEKLRAKGIDLFRVFSENDSYHALMETGGLLVTGPTGTNVNDVAVALVR